MSASAMPLARRVRRIHRARARGPYGSACFCVAKKKEKAKKRRRFVDGVSWTASRGRRLVPDVAWTTSRGRRFVHLPQPYGAQVVFCLSRMEYGAQVALCFFAAAALLDCCLPLDMLDDAMKWGVLVRPCRPFTCLHVSSEPWQDCPHLRATCDVLRAHMWQIPETTIRGRARAVSLHVYT